jgi:tRNA pseudouridine38-40 synthase
MLAGFPQSPGAAEKGCFVSAPFVSKLSGMEEEPHENPPAETETRRLRLRIAYAGGAFQGWQSQARGDTIQDRLEAAFAALCGGGRRIVVHGSGRTDAGVHARGQIAHADVPVSQRMPVERWLLALNAHLPSAIRVEAARFVSRDFHARFSARGKIYRYRIWNAPSLNPFQAGRAWHLPGALDLAAMREAAGALIGEHDFFAFAANRGQPDENTVRTIRRADIVRHRGALLTLEFEGDGFLYKMVRLMVGNLVRCAQGRLPVGHMAELLTAAQTAKKTTFCAPAEGLFLMRVLYDSTAKARPPALP